VLFGLGGELLAMGINMQWMNGTRNLLTLQEYCHLFGS
jgi:hypothetical protein